MYVFGSGRGGRCWGELVTRLGLGFTNSGGTCMLCRLYSSAYVSHSNNICLSPVIEGHNNEISSV